MRKTQHDVTLELQNACGTPKHSSGQYIHVFHISTEYSYDTTSNISGLVKSLNSLVVIDIPKIGFEPSAETNGVETHSCEGRKVKMPISVHIRLPSFLNELHTNAKVSDVNECTLYDTTRVFFQRMAIHVIKS